ncbi:MAG: hypothetical protein R3A79_02425 [Nannocystaceae bacterium]
MPQPTLYDWIARSRETSGEARRQALAQAEAAARATGDEHEWRAVASAYREAEDDASARRCLSRAIDADPLQVWCYRDLAALLRDRLDDPAGALATLAAAEAAMDAADAVPGYRWNQLAGLYRDFGASAAIVRRVVDSGLARAATLDDRCAAVSGYARLLGDAARARELLADVEARATAAREIRGWWTIANTYSGALDDPAGARRSVERGLALAETPGECVTMANAWGSHRGDAELLGACLAKAEALATTSDAWLTVAEAHSEHTGDREACRRCLDHVAADPDAGDDRRRRAAHGYRHWLDDPEAADRLSPRGKRPEELAPRRRALAGWSADASALLEWLRPRLSAEIMGSIAAADYGFGRDDNLAALRDIHETGLLPIPLGSQLHEVCALCRWADGERVDHVERAFTCAMLCLDYVCETSCFTDDLVSTLPQLVESCVELGPEPTRALVSLLVWLVEREEPEEALEDEGSGVLACLYALLVAAASLDPDDPRLASLARSVLAIEAALSQHSYLMEPARGWLNRVLGGIRDEKWRQITRRVLGPLRAEAARFPYAAAIYAAMFPLTDAPDGPVHTDSEE